MKGFTECKAKVSKSFSGLDLKDDIPKGEEWDNREEEDEEEEARIPVWKVEVTEPGGIEVTEIIEDAKKVELATMEAEGDSRVTPS